MTSDGPSIREATSTDAAALAPVYRSVYAENEALGFPMQGSSVTPSAIASWIETHTMLIATVDGEIVGGVRLSWPRERQAKISRLAVHDRLKGRGIGSRLLSAAEERVRDADGTAITLTTPPDHPYLPAFYRDRGYRIIGDYPLEDRPYDEVIMEKKLG